MLLSKRENPISQADNSESEYFVVVFNLESTLFIRDI
jgi:hypothetical protein